MSLHKKIDEPPLQMLSSRGEKVISEWNDIARHLARITQPSHLKLHFVCDVADFETANAVVGSFRILPTLARCDLRLGRHRYSALERLADAVVSRVTGKPLRDSTTPFPFLELPTKL